MKTYSGESTNLNARISIELLDRIDAQAKAFDTTRSMLIRSILEPLFLTRDELKARLAKEKAISDWIRAGMPEPDPAKKYDH
jgi:predicted transcriptional regulator